MLSTLQKQSVQRGFRLNVDVSTLHWIVPPATTNICHPIIDCVHTIRPWAYIYAQPLSNTTTGVCPRVAMLQEGIKYHRLFKPYLLWQSMDTKLTPTFETNP